MKNCQRFATITLTGLLLFLLNGCIPSLQPIYTADKLVMLNGLPGNWQEDKAKDSQDGNTKKQGNWSFRQGKGKNYLLVHEDQDGRKAAFDVHVVKLGSHFFMDFFPGDMPEETTASSGSIVTKQWEINDFLSYHLLPVHTFAKVEMSGKVLKISMFDPQFLEKLLERQQIRIKHEKTENGYLLTASSSDLQKFAEKYATEKEAFLDDPIVLNLKN